MKKLYTYTSLLFVFITGFSSAQDCQSTVKMVLFNITNGGHFAGQTVELTNISSKKTYTEISNAKGEATFLLPCDQRFDVKISNYASKDEIKSPSRTNSTSTRKYSYEADMIQKRKDFAMDDAQKAMVDRTISKLPDTTFIKGSKGSSMRTPSYMDNYVSLDITIIGLESQPLVGEKIVFSGRKRNKSFKAKTNSAGHVRVFLPKGDIYTINFHYHKDYRIEEVEYSKGTATVRIEIMYMGTKEYLRRKKAEEERMEQEKLRAAQAIARGSQEYGDDKVLETVMSRNNWKNKLLISDVSSEMLEYAHKLANWYHTNRKADETTQFVLYNNWTKRANSKSGSAFHMSSPNYDSLVKLIDYVYANVGLENAKYDIEGLIVGNGIEKPYDDVILFVDKDAGLMDYAYFKKLKAPVHVVLCVDARKPNAQHLTIAWKTKGSVHTFSGDFTEIGELVEGDTFLIEGYEYMIMGGEFITMN
ncbi:MAG: hypothetical protein COA38_18130 [Fluviicola sp.]|nr:MAG: hypothetical protein COA38_18130 [Fluviicola sp.]